MKPQIKHPWKNLTPQDAKKIQQKLLPLVKIRPLKDLSAIKKLAACDVSYRIKDDKIRAAVCIFEFPSLKLIEKISLSRSARGLFPYIPGLLSFREIPPLIEVFDKIKNEPDALLMDGQGIAHPRAIGLATHIGVIYGKISVGCAKSHLWGDVKEYPRPDKGSYTFLYPTLDVSEKNFRKNKPRCVGNTIIPDGKSQNPIGIVLRTREGVKPVFVSPGHLIDVEGAGDFVMSCVTKYRLPEPLRLAHQLTQ